MPEKKQHWAIGVLITICLGLSTWTIKEVYAHDGRIVKLETELVGTKELLIEVRGDVKKLLLKGNP